MKTSIRTIILAVATIFAAMSCQKEASSPETQGNVKTGETIQMNINASLGYLVSTDGAKATANPVIRLEWDGTETVDAYCGTTKLNTNSITVTPSENGLFAKLNGTITAPEVGQIITFVYSSGCTADGLTFNFSSQDANIPFVAYATLVYDGTALTDKMVEFKFATSVMKIAATNLGGGNITDANISGINTKVKLSPSTSDAAANIVSGDVKGTITKTAGIDASSDKTRAIFTVGLVPDNNTGRSITVKQTNYTNKGVITSNAIEASKSYTTPASLFTCGTLGSGADAHDYVLIAGTKWATQNLAITESGKKAWKGGNTTYAVKVPGTDSEVIVGDYFQYAASYKGYNVQAGNEKPDSLLIYTEFTNKGCGESEDKFTFRSPEEGKTYRFNTSDDGNNIGISPYYGGSAYTKYTTSDGIETLTPSDDVASILWSGTWRMPTSSEFLALKQATYWKWDGDDKGYYVYAPQSGDAGKHNNGTGTYDKSGALLFFPAAGFGDGTSLSVNSSYYWSSSFGPSYPGKAYGLGLGSGNVNHQLIDYRYLGFSVRPVSD